VITTNHIKDTLSELNEDVFSLYLHVDNARPENQADNPAWRIELKNALRDASEQIIETSRKDEWKTIQTHVDEFFNDYMPQSKSLVMFTDVNGVHTHELPVVIESTSMFGKPMLTPLLWAIDEYERYLIVQVDHEKARFISGYLGNTDSEGNMKMDIDDYDFRQRTLMPANMNQGDGSASASGGSNRDQYDALIDAHRQRFYRQVADHMRGLVEELGHPRIIVSGDEKAAHELKDELPDTFKIAGIKPISMNLGEDKVLAEVMDTALTYEREEEQALVDEVIGMAKAGGRGALGHAAVVQAITEQRVDTLLLTYPPTDNDIANDLKLKAFEANVTIELVKGDPAEKLEEEGGVAAKLYYAYEPTS